MRKRSELAFALLACMTALVPVDVHAFCRTRTDSTKARQSGGQPDADGCYGTGPELFWRNRCISYEIYGTPRSVAPDKTAQIIAAAFAKWTQTSCEVDENAGSNPDARISIDVRDLGETQCKKAGKGDGTPEQSGYSREGPNQNAIAFRNDIWPYRKEGDTPDQVSSTLGLTTVTYNENGEIMDADMELNTIDTQVSVDVIGPNDYDLASIITHEAGHFLGIAHSNDATATMFAEYQRGETRKQFLKLDDIRAICDAYQPGGLRFSGGKDYQPTACDPTPSGGIQRTCDDDGGGCNVHSTRDDATWVPMSALSMSALVFALRRRFRARATDRS